MDHRTETEQNGICCSPLRVGGWQVEWVESIDSTNSEMTRNHGKFDNMSVLSAWNQTAGRGQRGNSWKVAGGKNLTFSLMLRPSEGIVPPVTARSQFVLSEVATLSVRDTLRHFGIESRIKWPNDIYVGDRKICGMLVENVLSGSMVARSVVGIGLNVNQTEFPPELMNPISMALVGRRTFDLDEVLERFLLEMERRVASMDDPSPIEEEFVSSLYRLGEKRPFTDCKRGEEFLGTIEGLGEGGRLLLRDGGGELRSYAFKEVGYII